MDKELTFSKWLSSEEYAEWLYTLPVEEQRVINTVHQQEMLAYVNRFSDSTYGLMMLWRRDG